ncbi:MAG: glycosyltransferase family 2 protein, partial [Pedobacter sp.]|nr:glycosyltransferase family 2 protein [Chitinophagaceae bacterium]
MNSTQQPLVSVVVATYNGENFLGRQMDSILNQTYPNLEIIVVDDKSTDNTSYLIKNYAAKYSHIKVFINEITLGYVKNFEKGFLLAKGELIAPCDQDDVWDSNKISILVSEIGDHEIIYSNSELIDGNGEKLHKKLSDIKHLRSFDNCLNYTIGNTAPGHGMLIKREVIKRCIPFPAMVPHDFWLGFVATCNGPIKFYDKVLVQYRQHINNVFGAMKMVDAKKTPRKKISKLQTQNLAKEKMRLLYEKCPDNLTEQKKVLLALYTSYQNFSFKNNWLRMRTFFKYRKEILAYKNKP